MPDAVAQLGSTFLFGLVASAGAALGWHAAKPVGQKLGASVEAAMEKITTAILPPEPKHEPGVA